MDKTTEWKCIYKTSQSFEAEMIIGNLEAANIPSVMLNKQDSSYLNFGYIEIHVPIQYEKEALERLDEPS